MGEQILTVAIETGNYEAVEFLLEQNSPLILNYEIEYVRVCFFYFYTQLLISCSFKQTHFTENFASPFAYACLYFEGDDEKSVNVVKTMLQHNLAIKEDVIRVIV